jgi:pimeloyl-ACP methyl ester carboxylesterase
MKRITVRRDDVVLSALETDGDGRAVILLPGLAGGAEEFRATAAALPSDRHVIALDQRGHGHSTRRPADVSRTAYVDDVIAVIETLDDEPVDLVGQSMGAHTALLVAARRPDLIRRLVLLEGGVGGDGANGYPARLGQWFASWPVPFPDRDSAVTFLGSTATARAWAQDLEARGDGYWPRFDPDILESAIQAVADQARWSEWGQVTAPTLLVLAERSAIDPDEVQRMRAARPEAGHVVVPGSGHDVHLDQPEQWAAILGDYLEA